MRFAAALVLALGCSHPSSDCDRAVRHVLAIATAAPPGSHPSPDEQKALDEIAKLSISACKKEGLSPAQRDCLLAIKTPDDLRTIADCPAIAAKHPGWLISGGPMPAGSAAPVPAELGSAASGSAASGSAAAGSAAAGSAAAPAGSATPGSATIPAAAGSVGSGR